MTSEQIDNIKRRQQLSDCVKHSSNLTRPIVLPVADSACIYATESAPDGSEYGVILRDERYDEAILAFRECVRCQMPIDDIKQKLSKHYNLSLWSIKENIEMRIGEGFRAYWGHSRGDLFEMGQNTGGSVRLAKKRVNFFLIAATPAVCEIVELYFGPTIVIDKPHETPFRFSEFARFRSMERSRHAENVTVGVYIDVSSFRSVCLHRLESETQINTLMNHVTKNLKPDYDGFSVKLVLAELIANAFRHGNALRRSGQVLIRVAESEDAMFIEASDLRRGGESIKPRDHITFQDESGRGLYLVSAYSDHLFVDGCSCTAMIEKKKTNNMEVK